MDEKLLYQWKSKYGKIFKLKLEGRDIYFRLLSIKELENLNNKKDKLAEIVPKLVILNEDISLNLAGSFMKLSRFVVEKSVINNEDDFQLEVLQSRKNIKENFTLSLIAGICGVYPYRPDELMNKNINQLIEIATLAEATLGKNIIKSKGDVDFKNPNFKDNSKFEKPSSQELMDESIGALSEEMSKHGQKPKIFGKDKNKKLDPLQKQMKELQNFG